MFEWRTVKVGDLVKINISSYSKSDKWEFVNYLDTGSIIANAIGEIQRINLASEKLPSRAKRKVCLNDIVYSTVRPNQRHYGIIKSIPDNFLVSTGFAVLHCNQEKIIPDYLYFLLSQNDIVDSLHAIAEQSVSAYPSLKPSDIENLEITIPDLDTQKKIASVLMSITAKIEKNNEINKNLEQQTQALFTAWFESFEPFGGVAPASWRQVTLGDIAEIKTNSFNPQKNPDVLIEHYSIPTFDEKKYPVFEVAAGVKSNKYILSNNSVMISKLNPDTKRVWRPLCLSDMAVSSTEFIIFEAFNPKHKDYVYSVIDSQGFTDWMCSHTTGSTNSRQRTTPATTLNYRLWLPDDESMDQFLNTVTPMYDLIAHNLSQNQELISLIDTLLPKFMSGEIDVSSINF